MVVDDKTVVIDASFAGSWLITDESNRTADRVLARIQAGDVVVLAPQLWYYEMHNLLVSAIRQKRLAEDQLGEANRFIQALKPLVDAPSAVSQLLAAKLALKHHLSVYDATYVELALRYDAPLLTLDKALNRACTREGIKTRL